MLRFRSPIYHTRTPTPHFNYSVQLSEYTSHHFPCALPHELLSLPRVNRQLLQETAALVFSFDTFPFSDSVLTCFYDKPGEARVKHVEVLVIDLVGRPNTWFPLNVDPDQELYAHLLRLLRNGRMRRVFFFRDIVSAASITDAKRFVAGFHAAVESAGLSRPVQIELDTGALRIHCLTKYHKRRS